MADARLYVLDENHRPVPTESASAFAEQDRRVDLTCLPNGYRVSTTFLGINHNFVDDGPPILFETKVFPDGPGGQEYRKLFRTWDEAKAGHAVACATVASWPATGA